MARFDPNDYGPVFAALLAGDRRRPLDEGTPQVGVRQLLEALSPQAAFAPRRPHPGPLSQGEGVSVVDREMAACCLAGVWLLHDFLDESHTISQGIDTPSGSFWHAIMHRREGDFSNAKYWFRRVGQHPVLDTIGQVAESAAADANSSFGDTRLRVGDVFDPFAFVDLCEAAVGGQRDAQDFCPRYPAGGMGVVVRPLLSGRSWQCVSGTTSFADWRACHSLLQD